MDATYLQRFLSDSSRAATRNEVRELLKLIANPEVISLAGGMPSRSSPRDCAWAGSSRIPRSSRA